MTEIRTRFAPSPTGYVHTGNLHTAFFEWLAARHSGGKFIIRVEDTDRSRFVDDAADFALDSLLWLGLDWDEGPRKGGQYGPYVQSERRESYHNWALKLIDKGLAYADPYTEEQVEEFRKQATANKKPFLFRDFRPENPPVWDGTTPLRFKVPEIKRYSWHDEVMGDLTAGPEALDDFIIIKSDGLPTYNFAHIVDDIDMKITLVIRGPEFIPSTPKFLSVYDALGIEPPVMASVPSIMAPDGKKKLGKRDGAKSVKIYQQEGYLPEAMLNFLATMGWNDGTEQEIYSLDEIIEKFSLDKVQRSGARFDETRLLWMNGQWIRKLSLDDLFKRSADFWSEAAWQVSDEEKKKILGLVQDRLKTLADIPMMTSYFFADPTPNLSMITENNQLSKFSNSELITLLESSKTALLDSEFNPESIQETLNKLLETTGQKPGVLFSLIRIAVSWAPFSPALNETLSALGNQTVQSRLNTAIDSLK